MTPRNDVVRLRLTTAERESWAKAAGGKGKLSEWIRATCNSAAHENSGDGEAEPAPSGVPALKARQSRPLRETLDAVGLLDQAKVSLPPRDERRDDEPTAKQGSKHDAIKCPRWMHHRKGVYCGSCKRVN